MDRMAANDEDQAEDAAQNGIRAASTRAAARPTEHQMSAANEDPQEANSEELVRVVYRSDQDGPLMDVESTCLVMANLADQPQSLGFTQLDDCASTMAAELPPATSQHPQLSRAGSTLPSVAEESSNGGEFAVDVVAIDYYPDQEGPVGGDLGPDAAMGMATSNGVSSQDEPGFSAESRPAAHETTNLNARMSIDQDRLELVSQPIYSTVQKQPQASGPEIENCADTESLNGYALGQTLGYNEVEEPRSFNEALKANGDQLYESEEYNLCPQVASNDETSKRDDRLDECARANDGIGHISARQKAGAVEKGSFRNNFRKKLGLSVSTNENDLTAHRQKFIESVQDEDKISAAQQSLAPSQPQLALKQQQALPSENVARGYRLKRNHSVSFNVRSNRHSVDIRNLPSYLIHKRVSIVDVAKGAMSSIISSFGGNSNSSSVISGAGHRRDSTSKGEDFAGSGAADDEQELIFEEPIAPTLSLGQRVAMVRNSGTEFGTVGWIGQLADVDDDWVVGVIFDNMIGDCDGAYKGVRYFYARENYAMFVPLALLTKTDNYIGRPETGTVLSRMSVCLKPGQLISIQRSSIRLQHCFLNAPHQRVGHDVRAVSNRLHCQCHNCGPCAHLTKQGRPNILPHFGAHHLPIRKRNSLAHAAVEMLAHHHHHFDHEEEEHEEKDYEFGDNAAHACNFVRYSCCQQNGQSGHEFSNDCGMVRPELLDNLIHAPKAPHGRSRPRRSRGRWQRSAGKRVQAASDKLQPESVKFTSVGLETLALANTDTLETNRSSNFADTNTMSTGKSTTSFDTERALARQSDLRDNREEKELKLDGIEGDGNPSHSSYSLSDSLTDSDVSLSGRSRSASLNGPPQKPFNYYQYDTSSFRPQNSVFKTVDSQMNIMDQQRYVYRRDSSAVIYSSCPSNWSDTDSARSTGGIGRSILRCLGCLKRISRRPRRRQSFKDRVLEYRRRQSTFVPSTLAKPHEDFASHGIVTNHFEGHFQASHMNSDYSSCSRSSCSSLSNSPPSNYDPYQDPMGAGFHYQAAQPKSQHSPVGTYEQGFFVNNDRIKSAQVPADHKLSMHDIDSEPYKPQLDYTDYNCSDSQGPLNKNDISKDSAITNFPHSDSYKINSSSDTLKFLVDQSINEQIMPMQSMPENEPISPISSSNGNRVGGSTSSDHVDISSPTASLTEAGENNGQAEIERRIERLDLQGQDVAQESESLEQ